VLITGASIKFTQCVSGQKPSFSPLYEKLCVGSKNDYHLFHGLDVLYHHAKFEEIKLRTLAVGAKIWCFLFIMFGLPARGGHSLNRCCVTVYGSILMLFLQFFSEEIAL